MPGRWNGNTTAAPISRSEVLVAPGHTLLLSLAWGFFLLIMLFNNKLHGTIYIQSRFPIYVQLCNHLASSNTPHRIGYSEVGATVRVKLQKDGGDLLSLLAASPADAEVPFSVLKFPIQRLLKLNLDNCIWWLFKHLIRFTVSIYSRRLRKIEIASKKWCFEESGHNLIFCKTDSSLLAFFCTMNNDDPH